MAEVALGRAGIVLGLEVSRLARNSSDWHRLLEMCAMSGTLILDEDGVYDPCQFNDRLLFGLKGAMSEAELHVLQARLQGGMRNKARRGELLIPIPIGFAYDAFVVYDSAGTAVGTATSTGTITTANKWYHVAATINASRQMKAWLGGAAGTQVTATSLPTNGDTKLQLGRALLSGVAQDHFSGRIDEVRVSNVVRYTATFTPATGHTSDASTMALWKMQDDAGAGTGADSSTNGNTLTLTGTSWAGGRTSMSKRKRRARPAQDSGVEASSGATAGTDEGATTGAADGGANKLAAPTGVGWTQEFLYDQYGNRTWGAATTANAKGPVIAFAAGTNRITTGGYVHDAAGNLTNEPTATHAYDANNRVYSSTVGTTTTFVYDGEGRRVKKVGTTTTRFVYDSAGLLVAEYTGAVPTLATEYVYGASGLLATVIGTAPTYVTPDSWGTPRITTDATKAVIARHDYMPFGEELDAGDSGRSTGYGVGDGVRQKFTGYERDDETGLDYAKARYFASPQGRFTSVDPLLASGTAGNPQTWNRYTYSLNNPLRFSDPSGMLPEGRGGGMNHEPTGGGYGIDGMVGSPWNPGLQLVAYTDDARSNNGESVDIAVDAELQALGACST